MVKCTPSSARVAGDRGGDKGSWDAWWFWWLHYPRAFPHRQLGGLPWLLVPMLVPGWARSCQQVLPAHPQSADPVILCTCRKEEGGVLAVQRGAGSKGSSLVFTAEISPVPGCSLTGGREKKIPTLKSSLGEHIRRQNTFPYLLSVDYQTTPGY